MHPDMEQDPRDLLEDRGAKQGGGNRNRMSLLSELEKLPIMLVRCSFNNTYVNIQDNSGRLLTWISSVSTHKSFRSRVK
jgi:ribosomal protein S11